MRYLRRTWVVLIAIVGLLVTAAGAASASNFITDDGDTMLNFGYDETNHVFIADVSATNEPYDCTLADGILTVGYGDAGGTLTIPIDTLADGAGSFEFEVVDPAEGEPATAPYAGADGVCGLIGTYFDGLVDHGTFMDAFNAYLDTLDLAGGRGCLVRIVAQSDLGKDDQQITEVNPEFAIGETGGVQFTTEITDCSPGKPEFSDDHPGQGGGAPQSEEPHGQSGEEHGQSGSHGGGH